MKVILISTYQSGGAGTAATRLQEGLLAEGIDSSILCAHARNTRPDVLIARRRPQSFKSRIASKLGVHIVSKREREQKKVIEANGKYAYYSIPFSDYDIESHPLVKSADIINLHWVADFINFPTFFLKIKKPILWTFHDQNPLMGGFHYMGDMDKNRGNEKLMALEERYTKLKQDAINNGAIDICTPSKWLCNESLSNSFMKKFPHHHIANGLDTTIFKNFSKDFAREYFDLPKDKKIILFVSEIIENERKGFYILKEAVEKLNSKDEFIVVALGTVSNATVLDNFIFIESLHDEKLMALIYSASDVCVIPSREDNLPNVMIEALCCGTPVIGFPIGGVSETVIDNLNGILCDDTSISALTKGITEFFNNQPLNTNKIRDHAVKKYDFRIQARHYLDVYRTKLGYE
jgi:glycosyltransferase involved in cell wall biosynthesis